MIKLVSLITASHTFQSHRLEKKTYMQLMLHGVTAFRITIWKTEKAYGQSTCEIKSVGCHSEPSEQTETIIANSPGVCAQQVLDLKLSHSSIEH